MQHRTMENLMYTMTVIIKHGTTDSVYDAFMLGRGLLHVTLPSSNKGKIQVSR